MAVCQLNLIEKIQKNYIKICFLRTVKIKNTKVCNPLGDGYRDGGPGYRNPEYPPAAASRGMDYR